MGKIKRRITILTIGDRVDRDSYRKFHKERAFIFKSGFDYVSVNYKRFLTGGMPLIKTKRVIVFLFFPFVHWNKYIEHKNYKGIYGNRAFYKKFRHFWNRVNKTLKNSLLDKEVFFVNSPRFCGLYRDKVEVTRKFLHEHIPAPKLYNISNVKKLKDLLNKGHNLFLKPRYGSMGKGITFLTWSSWQTNFMFKNGKIISKKSDHGWKFRDITGNNAFLHKLIREDILIEKAVDSLLLKEMKVDMRIYTFFNKVIYIYPRRNRADSITTNISQGAKGDPGILPKLPKDLVRKAKKLATKVSALLGLNLVGMDIMMDSNLKDIYVIDVNLFPGFPKIKTFNLTQRMVRELVRLAERGMEYESF
ncbi:MAG: hypothetical protein JSV93_02985 [Candidatus Omnitrophota bacterium]|nr:MAG: hypothetical protein JSV93_02985 [Candidatus Omnitrophota bacterium]